MIGSRLRECLKTLRWDAGDLAEVLACEKREAEAWLDGRAKVPLKAGAWVEALVRAHQALPPPSLSSHAHSASEVADDAATAILVQESGEASLYVPWSSTPYPRRNFAAGAASAQRTLITTPITKGASNGSHPF